MDADLRAQLQRIVDKLHESPNPELISRPNHVLSRSESQCSSQHSSVDDLRREFNERLKEQSQNQDLLRDWLKQKIEQVESAQTQLFRQVTSNGRDIMQIKNDLAHQAKEQSQLDKAIAMFDSRATALGETRPLDPVMAEIQTQLAAQHRETEILHSRVELLQARVTTVEIGITASSEPKQVPPLLQRQEASSISKGLHRKDHGTFYRLPSTASQSSFVGKAATVNSVELVESDQKSKEKQCNTPGHPVFGEDHKSGLRGDAPRFEFRFPAMATDQVVLTDEVFSTGLEKSKYAPSEVKALFGFESSFITPPKGSKAIPLIKPRSDLDSCRSGFVLQPSSTTSFKKSSVRNDTVRQANDVEKAHPSEGAGQTLDVTVIPPHVRDIIEPKANGDAQVFTGPQHFQKSSPPPSNVPIPTVIRSNEESKRITKSQDENKDSGESASVASHTNFATANASFQTNLQKAVDNASKSAKLKNPMGKENVQPTVPEAFGKQDFVAQMMAGLQEFQKKHVAPPSSRATPDTLSVAEDVSVCDALSTMSDASKSSKTDHKPSLRAITNVRLKKSRSSSVTLPTRETCIFGIDQCVDKIKDVFKNIPRASYVFNIQHFAMGLYMPTSKSGKKIQVKLSTVDLRDSGETELSLQLRCDDWKTVHLVFQGKCNVAVPLVWYTANIKLTRTIGSDSFLTKRQPTANESNDPLIYGMEYVVPANDPELVFKQHPDQVKTMSCAHSSTLQFLSLWTAFRDSNAKKFAVRFPGDEKEAAATWNLVETFLRKVDERVFQMRDQKWMKKETADGGRVYWKLESPPWVYR